MTGTPTSAGKYAFGFCDRCGQRYDLHELKYEVTNRRRTGLRVCSECLDPDHPQNWQGQVRANDVIALRDPRPDASLEASRKVFSWNPVGNQPTTSEMVMKLGRVRITTT